MMKMKKMMTKKKGKTKPGRHTHTHTTHSTLNATSRLATKTRLDCFGLVCGTVTLLSALATSPVDDSVESSFFSTRCENMALLGGVVGLATSFLPKEEAGKEEEEKEEKEEDGWGEKKMRR